RRSGADLFPRRAEVRDGRARARVAHALDLRRDGRALPARGADSFLARALKTEDKENGAPVSPVRRSVLAVPIRDQLRVAGSQCSTILPFSMRNMSNQVVVNWRPQESVPDRGKTITTLSP